MNGPFAAEPLEVHVVRDDDDAVLGPPHVHLEHLRPAILDGVPEGKDELYQIQITNLVDIKLKRMVKHCI